MPKKSEREKSLSTNHDRDHHNSPTDEQEEFVGNNGQVPYVDNYWAAQPYPNWDPSMGIVPYVQYPPNVYYQPYGYQTTQPVQPQYLNTSESPPAPLSRNTKESENLDVIPPSTNSASVQQNVNPFVPMQNSQPPLPPPRSYYDPYSQPFLPPQSYYDPYSQPSPYYYSHPPLPPPYYYYGASSLPPIPPRESRHERVSYDRRRHGSHLIMSYFGRRHNIDSYQKHHR